MDFKPGDVVKLKSGGERMTVEEIGEYVSCVWFNAKKIERDSFDPVVLEKAPDGPTIA